MVISTPIKKLNVQVILRKYQKKDFKRIVELDKEAQINQKQSKIELLTDAKITKVSPKNGGLFIVVEVDKEVVGMGAMKRIDTKTCELEYVRVTPRYQGMGIGTIIIQKIEVHAAKLHYSRIKCLTCQARKFYEKLGYSYIGEKEYSDGPCDSIMEKKV